MTRTDRRAETVQALTVLALAVAVGLWRMTAGSAGYFDDRLAPRLGLPTGTLWAFVYHFGSMALLGFVLPVAVLLRGFGRRPAEIGLGRGDLRPAVQALLVYLPLAALGCRHLARMPAFQARYPMHAVAAESWGVFLAYEALFLLYWLGWEYLWRGAVLFGTAPRLGRWAIAVQAIPFAALHLHKPWPEALLSLTGALLLGALVWRSRSFWVAVPLHAGQMLAMDLFSVLERARAAG